MSTAVLLEPVAATSSLVDTLLSEARSMGVRVPHPEEIRAYVERFPDVVPVARQACELTVAEFDGKSWLSLEVYFDPEIDDSYLVIYVQDDDFSESVRETLENIFETYAERMTHSAGWVNVMPSYHRSTRRD